VFWQIWAFFLETLYPASHRRERRRHIPSIQSSQVGPANRSPPSTYWRSVQPCWSAEKPFRLDAKAVPKIVGGFLKLCGDQVQVSCPFSPLLGFSHWKAKLGWFCGARWMQKNVSLRSRQVKNLPPLGQGLKACMDLGLWGAK
jgi:hypothetical protein